MCYWPVNLNAFLVGILKRIILDSLKMEYFVNSRSNMAIDYLVFEYKKYLNVQV